MALVDFDSALHRITVLTLMACCFFSQKASSVVLEEKVCLGTHNGFSEPPNYESHLEAMRIRYNGCTFVDGNLELTWMREEDLDVSFLQHIREVTGYILFFNVGVPKITFPNLQVIRGEKLLKTTLNDGAFAILVTTVTSESIEMPSLLEIWKGSVGFIGSPNLCYIQTIVWDKIQKEHSVNVLDFSNSVGVCPTCDLSCKDGCWGQGPQKCQSSRREDCHPECSGRSCFGKRHTNCCHSNCADECNGPRPTDCLACKNFNNDGTCVQNCPQDKLVYGSSCVAHCPAFSFKNKNVCVHVCPPQHNAVNGECIPCDGTCPKVCHGSEVLHSGNIENYHNCTIINGSIVIRDITFTGFQKFHANFIPGPLYGEMNPRQLEYFRDVKEITGYLDIRGSHTSFTNLSYFRNLQTIGGNTLTDGNSALLIEKTSLKVLGLTSLRRVKNGRIAIMENKNLCLTDQIDWNIIKESRSHTILIQKNRPVSNCVADGIQCHKECSPQGCWGVNAHQCISCENYKLKNLCIGPCDNSTRSSRNSSQREVCFTKVFLPGHSLYVVDDIIKELIDIDDGSKELPYVYVISNEEHDFWVQHLNGTAESENPVTTEATGTPLSTNEEIDTESCSNNTIKWKSAEYGFIPNGGFVGGTDPKCMLYVGNTYHNDELLPGKICPRYNSIYVAWEGKEYVYHNYKVLIGSTFDWIPATGRIIPPCAVKGGQLKDGTPLYIGRKSNEGALDIGMVNPTTGLFYLPKTENVQIFEDYEILVYKETTDKDLTGEDSRQCTGQHAAWTNNISGTPPSTGFIGGGYGSTPYYVGRASHYGDLIPGKVHSEWGSIYISWGGEEFEYKTYQVLEGSNYEWIPATGKKIPACAVQGGYTMDRVPLYIGRITYSGVVEIGKVNPIDGLLYMPYFKKEIPFAEYEILVFKAT